MLNRIKAGKAPVVDLGAPTLVSSNDERLIAKFCIERCKLDSCIDEGLVKAKALDLAKASGRCEPTRTELPSNKWLKGFIERNPSITLRIGQRQSDARRESMTDAQLQQFEDRMRTSREEHGIIESWQFGVWDEAGTHVGLAEGTRVIASSASKSAPISQGKGEHRPHATLGVGAWASGHKMDLFTIFTGVRFSFEETTDIADHSPDSLYVKSPSGGSDGNTMINWLNDVVLPFRAARPATDQNKWMMILVDEFDAHANDLAFLNLCDDNKVCIMSGIAHGTHKWQVPDTHFIAPLKQALREETLEFYRECAIGEEMTNGPFLACAKRAYACTMTSQLIQKAFKDVGLEVGKLRLFDALKHKVANKSDTKAAAERQAIARQLRIRDAPEASAPPPVLTTEWALSPGNRFPATPLDSWSRMEIYEVAKRMQVLNHRGLAEPEIKRQKRIADGASESTSKELTAPKRLAAMKIENAKREEEAVRRAKASAELKARQVHICARAKCTSRFTTANALAKHAAKRHPV